LHESNGTAVALSDEEILEAQSLTARLAGVFAEPAAATSVAAARRLRATQVIGPDELVICNLTGHGLKQPEAIRIEDRELKPISPTLAALSGLLKRIESAVQIL
jgi:threonine synthase